MKNRPDKNENDLLNRNEQPESQKTKLYFYFAIGACVLAAAAFGLSFSFMGIYALIASIVFELTALSFAGAQKKKHNLPAVKFITIIAYVLLALSALLFIGGMIYTATA